MKHISMISMKNEKHVQHNNKPTKIYLPTMLTSQARRASMRQTAKIKLLSVRIWTLRLAISYKWETANIEEWTLFR